MDRRKVLLATAAVIAVLGTLLVFLYVRGADNRAAQQYDAVKVLRAVKQIDPGETVAAAQAAGKIELGSVPQGQVLPGALTDLSAVSNQVANTTIYPGEQIISTKFGATGSGTTLTIPKGKMAVSVNLTDPARVAGFVNPGDEVAIYMQGAGLGTAGPFSRLLLPKVEVIGVGTTTVVSTTKTDSSGAQTTEQLPRTLITLALDQAESEKVLFASGNGELALGLLNKDSKVHPDRGVSGSNLFR
ncbi:Flp pilus assembly protein CpaB [Nocardioides terrisoli]|uniref:Flp pilus assembly protein CpaB n=1 Tax=Nocardioides terrisoli TaxID=3388267 RepID=UPI00287B96FA|nr:Flp pilus assembly protein CpaB [Nocardioides marmorisolisilvae]